MSQIYLSESVIKKLKTKHKVSQKEIEECFLNADGRNLKDIRSEHKTIPPTQWFIAETNKKRKIKVCFIFFDGVFHIKTAYEPNQEEIKIYTEKAY